LSLIRFDRFHKADKDLNQPPPLQRLQIYFHAENGTVNKVLDLASSDLLRDVSDDMGRNLSP